MYVYLTNKKHGGLVNYTDLFENEEKAKKWYKYYGKFIEKKLGKKLIFSCILDCDNVDTVHLPFQSQDIMDKKESLLKINSLKNEI